jgi:hypothetical protein
MSTFPKTINEFPEDFFASLETLDPKHEKKAQAPILAARRQGHGKLESLMRGEWQSFGYPSQSEADEALCGILVHKVGPSAELIDRLFRSSGLMREKWDKVHVQGKTYGQATIARVLNNHQVEEIPEDVDFEALAAPEAEIPAIPNEVMYGKVAEMARASKTPLGFAYPVVLAAACGSGIYSASDIRPTLYVALIGDVHTGKSVARERLAGLFRHHHLQITDESYVIEKTPGSDRGLYTIFAETAKRPGRSYLLSLDEMRNMMLKGSIENASLISVLCELWSKNFSGGADKKGSHEINLKLSIVGCLKAANPEEFAEVFNHHTAAGLWDRFVFGFTPPLEKWHYTSLTKLISTVERFSEPTVSPDIEEAIHQWINAGKDRDRLGEIAARVAYISAAINGDTYLCDAALQSALRFVEWQEKIREIYRPAKGSNEWQECMNAVLDAFENAPGKALHWRQTATKKHWYRSFPRALSGVKRTLERDGVIVESKEHKKHFYQGDATCNNKKQ